MSEEPRGKFSFKFFVAFSLSITFFSIIPTDSFAARLFSSGCEFQGDAISTPENIINGLEFQRDGIAANSTKITRLTKRSGISSCEVTHATNGWGSFYHEFADQTRDPHYFRFYLNVATMPALSAQIAAVDSPILYGEFGEQAIVLNPNGTLSLHGDDNNVLDTDTTVLAAGQWYRIEWFYDANGGVEEVRLNGNVILTDYAHDGGDVSYFILGLCTLKDLGGSRSYCSTTGSVFFDDIAINDAKGTSQNSWPGDGAIVHLQPNAAGDTNNCLSPNNYTHIDEVTPDESATICNLTQTNDKVEVNLESSTSAGIDSRDSISLVQVGIREKAAQTSTESWQLSIKSKSGATPSVGFEASHDDQTFTTNGDNAPRNYTLTSYKDPTTACSWTQNGSNSLTNMQIGAKTINGSTDINVTALWALVEYSTKFPEPCVLPNNGNPPDAVSIGITNYSPLYKQSKSGGFWSPSIAADKICLGNSLDCITSWNRTPKCRLEHHRVTARPNASNFPSWGLPDFANITTQKCDDMLSSASKTAGWVGTGYDNSLRVFSNDGHTPRVCQFSRIVCDSNVELLAPTATGVSVYPVVDFTTSTNQCSDLADNDDNGDYDYPFDAGCSSWSDPTESGSGGGGGGSGCPSCQQNAN